MMSKPSHTPGPWWTEKSKRLGGNQLLIVAGKDKENWTTIAEVYSEKYHRKTDYQFNDAHLIAAAPEMLEALEQIKGLLNDDEVAMQTLENIVDHAIAKARGEE